MKKTLEEVAKERLEGSLFHVSHADLGMSPEEFDEYALEALNEADGNGYVILGPHRESQSGKRRVDMLRVKKVKRRDE